MDKALTANNTTKQREKRQYSECSSLHALGGAIVSSMVASSEKCPSFSVLSVVNSVFLLPFGEKSPILGIPAHEGSLLGEGIVRQDASNIFQGVLVVGGGFHGFVVVDQFHLGIELGKTRIDFGVGRFERLLGIA